MQQMVSICINTCSIWGCKMIVQRRESRKREKLKCYQNAWVFQTPLSHTAIAGITFQLGTQKYAVVSEKSLMACFESVCLGQWLSWKACSQSVMMPKLHACLNKSWSQSSDFYFCFPPSLNKNVASYLLSVSRPLHNVWDKDTFFVSVCHHNRLQVKQLTEF